MIIMTQEEKAKAYDEAIETTRKWYDANTNEGYRGIFEEIFPELKESEDERIKNWIRKELESKYVVDNIVNNVMADKALAWLEKQVEQKPIDANEEDNDFTIYHPIKNECSNKYECFPYSFYGSIEAFHNNEELLYFLRNCFYKKEDCEKWCREQNEQKPGDNVESEFEVGDWITDGHKTHQITNVNGSLYGLDNSGYSCALEDNFHLWTIQDAKDGDVLVNWNNNIYLFKGIEEEVVKFYCYYSTNHEEFNIPFNNNSHLGLTEPQFKHHPATKEQRDLLFQKMKEAGYEWDAEKLELKKIEQKPAKWSEEDEAKIKSIIALLKNPAVCSMDGNKGIIDASIKYLKSLKDRVQSQPKQEWRQENTDDLTDLEDIKTIDKLLNQCVDCSNPYQEVLKRFKEKKE